VFTFPNEESPTIYDIFRSLVNDGARNLLIADDVLSALRDGRRCLILSQWKEHCRLLAESLAAKGKAPLVLSGDIGKKERASILQLIDNARREEELVVIATGEYLGEGFDCPQLDTLFLAFPVSFKGKVVQYVGRTLRSYQGKESAWVYDYLDAKVPSLSRMHARRLKTYKALGFSPGQAKF
jgi:superfamily II DNA or RNA helicase